MKEYSYNELNCSIIENLLPSCKVCNHHKDHGCIYQRLIQLYDNNLINKITDSKRFLKLLDSTPKQCVSNYIGEADNSFSTGGYTVSTTDTENDTLNLPGAGIYRISSAFISLFEPNEIIIFPGSSVVLEYRLIDGNDFTISISKSLSASIAKAYNTIDYAQAVTNIEVLYKTNEIRPSLRILLSDFNFDASLNNSVTVSNMSLIVQKLQDL